MARLACIALCIAIYSCAGTTKPLVPIPQPWAVLDASCALDEQTKRVTCEREAFVRAGLDAIELARELSLCRVSCAEASGIIQQYDGRLTRLRRIIAPIGVASLVVGCVLGVYVGAKMD